VSGEKTMFANEESVQARLSRIETCWMQVRRGLEGQAANEFLRVYGEAVSRYLLGLTRGDEHVAAELFQDFCVKLLQGRYRKASPEHGKFRHYLKRCLVNLASDRRSRLLRQQTVPIMEELDPSVETESPSLPQDQEFNDAWRQALITTVLQKLELEEGQEPRGRYPVLQARLEAPNATSEQLAAKLSAGGKTVSSGWVRKRLMEARGRFAELLLDEVARTLDQPTLEAVQDELLELGLWEYCRHFVESAAKP
jgi:DNA-directed RNA polymerase specialized sigma24 family protein